MLSHIHSFSFINITICPSFSYFLFFFLMIRRPPRSTLFPSRRSSDLGAPGQGPRSGRGNRRAAANRYRPPSVATPGDHDEGDRKSTRLNSSHQIISYAVFCLKKKKKKKKIITKNNITTKYTQSDHKTN